MANIKPVSILTNKSTDTHGFVAVDHTANTVFVVFRGTEDLENWITDLNAFGRADFDLPLCGAKTSPATSIKVHPGFYHAYESVQAQMMAALAQVASNGGQDYEVVVTGHSLGASIATIAGLDLVCDHPYSNHSINVYNYGSPRIGESAFADLIKGPLADKLSLMRYTHWRDPVPHLPLIVMDYHHAPTEYFLDEHWDPPKGNHAVHTCDGTGEDKACSDKFDLYSVEDHLHYFDVHLGSGGC
jgi:hypothetical protein